MAKNSLKRISDIVPLDQQMPPILSGKEVIGQEFILTDFEYKEGEQGDYYLLTCIRPDDPEQNPVLVNSGAIAVMKVCEILADKTQLPLYFKFVPVGRSYRME